MKVLGQILDMAVQAYRDRIAVEDRFTAATYEELYRQSVSISENLCDRGIQEGDRVGIYAHKSIETVAAILGTLKANAVYVPVGVDSPPARNSYIFDDCLVKVIIVEQQLLPQLEQECGPIAVLKQLTPNLLLLQGPGMNRNSTFLPSDSLAYILYTSGSTGNPKGVMYPHQGALRFVEWCASTFPISYQDRFSSHAPFHFDLSIFDLYVCFRQGATLELIDEETGRNPLLLAEFIAEKKISVWYSTPSILSLLTQYGKLEKHDYSALRLVLFAGEVFPIKYLRSLASCWQGPRFFNLYGPTETNVCTYFEIPKPISDERTQPFPIGKSCSHMICELFDENGVPVRTSEQGELCVTGDIMSGYWNQPEKTATVFFVDDSGTRWYRTGDIVVEEADGNFVYAGRRDRMVKRRGYRIELGEIESKLYEHPAAAEVAVIALHDNNGGIQIKAFLQVTDSKQASLIKFKQYAADVLPSYMIPDRFVFIPVLPKTTTGKVDYQQLRNL